MLRLPPMYRKRSARDGSGVQAACHQRCSGHRPSHYRADISHLLSAKRSRSCGRKAALCRRWRAGSGEPHQPFPASCGATPPLAVAAWSIARRPHSGTPSDRLVGQNRRSLRSIRPYALMCKSAWPEWYSLQAGLQFLVRPCHGKGGVMDRGRTADGRALGAPSRSHGAYRSTSLMT